MKLTLRARTLLFRLWIVVFTGVMVWAGLTALHAVAEVKHNAAHDEAARCIDAWHTHDDISNAIRITNVASAEALISVFPEAPPDRIAGYRASVSAQAEQAQAELADPDCDLEAARAELR